MFKFVTLKHPYTVFLYIEPTKSKDNVIQDSTSILCADIAFNNQFDYVVEYN